MSDALLKGKNSIKPRVLRVVSGERCIYWTKNHCKHIKSAQSIFKRKSSLRQRAVRSGDNSLQNKKSGNLISIFIQFRVLHSSDKHPQEPTGKSDCKWLLPLKMMKTTAAHSDSSSALEVRSRKLWNPISEEQDLKIGPNFPKNQHFVNMARNNEFYAISSFVSSFAIFTL